MILIHKIVCSRKLLVMIQIQTSIVAKVSNFTIRWLLVAQPGASILRRHQPASIVVAAQEGIGVEARSNSSFPTDDRLLCIDWDLTGVTRARGWRRRRYGRTCNWVPAARRPARRQRRRRQPPPRTAVCCQEEGEVGRHQALTGGGRGREPPCAARRRARPCAASTHCRALPTAAFTRRSASPCAASMSGPASRLIKIDAQDVTATTTVTRCRRYYCLPSRMNITV
jgi:hypothetical protein